MLFRSVTNDLLEQFKQTFPIIFDDIEPHGDFAVNMQATGGARMDTDAVKVAVSEQIIQDKAEEYAELGWEMTRDGDEYVFNRNPGYGCNYA